MNPSWRQIDFRVYYKDGSVVDVEALRPQSWIDSRGFKVGSRIDLNLPERPLLGRATVTAIGDCPCIDIGNKNDSELVITTYRTLHRVPILKVLLENGESIQGTVDHRIWSASESAWKQLQELEPGESVQTRFGDLKVRSSQLQSTRQRVYNFEVQGQHVYEVSDSGILVHNTGGCEELAEEIARRKALAPKVTPSASTVKGIKAAGTFDDTVKSLDEARAAVQKAFPDAVELPRAIPGKPYPSPPPGVKKWYQVHPAEPGVGNNLPHIKYVDWTTGKKGTGGSWGHIFFPE